ncbi:MAG: sulfatase-like hydrolase/transferase, partial [Acidobacteria bacterium]|nr:sulfatase-like hydrolase/transferase [Acidobacteriota bacterium]
MGLLKRWRQEHNSIRFFILFFLLCLPWLLSVTALTAHSRFPQEKENGRRNLLLITIDTLRADSLGCYGNLRAKTPSIDGLAKRGVLFSRAFANTSTTLPSHANILLGTTPLHHGVHENIRVRREGCGGVGEGPGKENAPLRQSVDRWRFCP